MRGLDPEHVLTLLGRWQVVGLLRSGDEGAAVATVRACHRGGLRAVEVDVAAAGVPWRLLRQFTEEPSLLVGVGRVVTAAGVREAAGAGAAWVTVDSPSTELVGAARDCMVPLMARVRSREAGEAALGLGVSALRLALPWARQVLAEGLPDALIDSNVPLTIEAGWPTKRPDWAPFLVITQGLFHGGCLGRGDFLLVEEDVRARLELL